MESLETIIREAALSPEDFPKASQLPVKILDRKNRPLMEPLHFHKELFAANPASKEAFEGMLNELEKCRHEFTDLEVKIGENMVLVRSSNLGKPRQFYRLPPFDPLDFT